VLLIKQVQSLTRLASVGKACKNHVRMSKLFIKWHTLMRSILASNSLLALDMFIQHASR
jgi:hypothetical protein